MLDCPTEFVFKHGRRPFLKMPHGSPDWSYLVHGQINVENPCTVMSQDKVKQFLHTGSASDRYKVREGSFFPVTTRSLNVQTLFLFACWPLHQSGLLFLKLPQDRLSRSWPASFSSSFHIHTAALDVHTFLLALALALGGSVYISA
jgi:hypothetical protein